MLERVLSEDFSRARSRRITLTPDPDTFEKYRDTPPISIATLLQKYALLLAESSAYTTNLYRDTPPICTAILLQKYQGQGSLEHPQSTGRGSLTPQLMRRFCPKMLRFPGQTLGISEALWPQGLPHSLRWWHLTKLITILLKELHA